MCGIFCAQNVAVAGDDVARIQSLLAHRGPDGHGVWQNGRITLIHSRLSIIDLSDAGRQPMLNAAGDCGLVFNGEIYNYVELKKAIPGYPYQSHSDTEVILAAYEAWGEAFVEKLRGMFALCLYDRKKDKLILAVDRFSIKPLYYHQKDDRLIAASEIKPILPFLRERRINPTAVSRFLNFGMLNYDHETFFQDIHQLQGGEMLVREGGAFRKKTYWDAGNIAQTDHSREDFLELTRAKLNEAIALHWRSDVEVGLNLSSGLDSNALYEFSKASFPRGQQLRGFTYCFPGTVYDEGARIDSKRFAVEHIKTDIMPERFFERLEKFIVTLEEPALGLGCLGYYDNSRAIHDRGIKVVLDGQGADEIFGGYKYYYFAYLKELYRRKDASFERELDAFLKVHDEDGPKESFIKKHLLTKTTGAVQAPDGTSLDANNFVHPEFQRRHFAPLPEFPRGFEDPVKNMMYTDLKFLKIPKLLRYQDKASMASSVEVRVPFLDHELVEAAFSAPVGTHLREGRTKAVLRDLYAVFGVEDQSAGQRKLYVATPQREWMKQNLKAEILESIEHSVLDKERIIEGKKLKQDYLAYCASPDLGNSFFIWKFLTLEIWFRNFMAHDVVRV